jgi:hypothetical protein
MPSLGVRTQSATPDELSAWSRAALDVALDGDAELWVTEVTEEARVVGAFERAAGVPRDRPLVQRGSGGPSVLVGPGTVHVLLLLAEPAALVACDAARLVNRYVRPLLRALTTIGAPAHYFGRDWISVLHRPAAWIGFAHDGGSRRAAVEAFVAVDTPFASEARASFLGKEPGTLAAITGKAIDTASVARAVAHAYADAYARVPRPLEAAPHQGGVSPPIDETPWRATVDEVIGPLGAGPDQSGVLRLGGALLASRDAVREVEGRAVAVGPDEIAMGSMVDAVFRAPRTTIDGVRSLGSVRDVLVRALSASGS